MYHLHIAPSAVLEVDISHFLSLYKYNFWHSFQNLLCPYIDPSFSDVNSISSVTGTLWCGKLPTLNYSVTEKPTQHFHWQVKEMFIIQYCSFAQWYSYSFAVVGRLRFSFSFSLILVRHLRRTYFLSLYDW